MNYYQILESQPDRWAALERVADVARRFRDEAASGGLADWSELDAALEELDKEDK